MDVGARVWIADPADAQVWLAARILTTQAAAVTVEMEDQQDTSSRKTDEDASTVDEAPSQSRAPARREVALVFSVSGGCSNVLPRNLPREQDQSDLVALPHLHEASILQALRLRYARHAIYTHIGDILISINPFQSLPQLYASEVLQRYAYDHTIPSSDRSTASATDPHLFAVARAAYMDIVQNGRSQAILISGESGAGKTEATKIMMTYFALTCGTATSSTPSDALLTPSTPSPASPRTTIETQVLQSNPILEAFGNARTVRNDNSSRFGKFIELRFRDGRRRLAGARIRTYLLEKIRVIKQAPHERNFHIFYELLSADASVVTAAQRQAWALDGGAARFRLLNQSACCERRDGVKDGEQFRATRRAMQQLGMSEQEVANVLEIVAAVLHMGNVDFEPAPHKREDSVFVDEARVVSTVPGAGGCNHFEKAAELLRVSTQALDHALTKRWLHASNETLVVGVDVEHARNTRNALAMECYRLLFEWLVARVNSRLQLESSRSTAEAPPPDEADFIGLLDIFGFEDMAENSFEQLCINYANEALQHQFNQFVFEEEQRLYRDEGIRWSFVDFPNNRACLELFEQRPIGLFSLTDQECVFPQGTDRALVAKYYQEFEKKTQHAHFCSAPALQRATHFVVAHYAGRVTYTVDGFLAKNKDSFCESAARLLAGSSNPLIQALAAGSVDAEGDSDPQMEGKGGRNLRRAKSAIAAVSVGSQFKIQLNELLATVRATTPRYVRCIKPNDAHVGGRFESSRVVEQLRSGGVLEAVRVARAGFPVRLSHDQFLRRYRRVLLSLRRSSGQEDAKEAASELDRCLQQLTQLLAASSDSHDESDDEDDAARQARCGVSLGKTRVFFRRDPYERLEKLRVTVRQTAALVLQRHVRGFAVRSSFRRLRRAAVAVQTRVRGRRACQLVRWMRAMKQARVLQTRMRQLCARSRFLRARAGVLAVQCSFRCRRAARIVQTRREARAVTRLATAWRRASAQRKFRQLCRAALALQCAARARVAKRALKGLREESRNVTKLQQDNLQLKDELAELRRRLLAAEQQSSPSPREAAEPAANTPQKSVGVRLNDGNQSQEDGEGRLSLELEELDEDAVTLLDGGNPNAADGRDASCVVDLRRSEQKPKLRSPNSRRSRRYSLPPMLTPADENAPSELTPPKSPRAPRARDRRHSLDLWRLQQEQAQEEARQLRDEIRETALVEAAAAEPSPERQQLQELALQKLVAAQIKRKTMQLQLQVPAFELKTDNNGQDAGPASCRGHRRRSRTVGSPVRAGPLTSCGPQQRDASRWSFATPRGSSCGLPAYFDGSSYAGSAYGDDASIDGDDDLYRAGRGRYAFPTRSASAGVYRGRTSSIASSSCWTPPAAMLRGEATVPRFAKAPTCKECDCAFNLLVRRHHCRQCGHSFCFEHSTRQLALPHLGYTAAQRVCDGCFESHVQALNALKMPLLLRHPTDELSTSSFASSPRGLESNDSYCALDSPDSATTRVAPLPLRV
ncbi:hypothetical protein BBJ28_00019857 [Nothophytophthora sp. Chile5]|nr:hypothetical protein BBJ28_00019857 [Nothophytophthora sp. Chile5]